ncbi:exosortase F system-associated protein [Psychroflexus sp. YR1-1]|uniref:Exosortase F system-associated protein n=1 Tax=Psychroflexus aurantiacus TaxID=2709310 RepID=A0A6B3R1E7_9FLAO|nr:exosortase F system-associated protein [Psychroflexus aurantiacus]NEV94429.1 exosortase F system-associated protein [Psychroflexus aurantiacus]
MHKFLKWGLLALLVIGLALIRYFEHELFSDPFLEFFRSAYRSAEVPEIDTLQIIASTSWRFLLNTILSLGIIWIAFPARKTFSFSLAFYGFAYVILISLFWFFITDMKAENYFLIFYIRRFLIQPIFLLILLPAFYYQKRSVKEK